MQIEVGRVYMSTVHKSLKCVGETGKDQDMKATS